MLRAATKKSSGMRSKSHAANPASPWVPPKGPKTKGPWNALGVDMDAGTQWVEELGPFKPGRLTVSNHTGTKDQNCLEMA